MRPNYFVSPRLLDPSHKRGLYSKPLVSSTIDTRCVDLSAERIQKVLARAGLASRRASETILQEGRVRINGRVVTELGSRADPSKDKIEVDGRRIMAEPFVYLVLHKPRLVVSTVHDPEGRATVRQLVAGVPERIHPIGRLDFHTSGTLLLTNDGEFTQGLLHPRCEVPKVYVVKVQGCPTDAELEQWRRGVQLEGEKTAPCRVRRIRDEDRKTWLEVTLTEGKNQQIRRMGDATGFPVMRLARLSFAGVTSEGLRPGSWRMLTADELRQLKETYGVPRRVYSQKSSAAVPSAKIQASKGTRKRSPSRTSRPR